MKQSYDSSVDHGSRAHGTAHGTARSRGEDGVAHEPADRNPVTRAVMRLQRAAGNAAVARSIEQTVVQREPDDPNRAAPAAANPMLGALWDMSVVQPIHKAANAMVDPPKADYKAAFDLVLQAEGANHTATAALPTGDPRVVKANYLQDDLVLVASVLAPRANVTVSTTDDDVASKLGGLEYDAQVVGASMGGNPAPAQQQLKPEDQTAGR